VFAPPAGIAALDEPSSLEHDSIRTPNENAARLDSWSFDIPPDYHGPSRHHWGEFDRTGRKARGVLTFHRASYLAA
jgi:hypothetical protein